MVSMVIPGLKRSYAMIFNSLLLLFTRAECVGRFSMLQLAEPGK
jgi:hypothetical protein